MNEEIEKEWMERNRRSPGDPLGLRRYKTEFNESVSMEEVILAIAEPMRNRNKEKKESRDPGIFYQEYLEELFLGDDGFWRYVVIFGYIPANSEIRKRQQTKIKQIKAK